MILLCASILLGLLAVVLGWPELRSYRERRRIDLLFWEQVRQRPPLYNWADDPGAFDIAADDGLWPW